MAVHALSAFLLAALVGSSDAVDLPGSPAALCAAAPAAEVAAVLGEGAATPTGWGPGPDEDHPNAITTSCQFVGTSGVVILYVLKFRSIDEAIDVAHSEYKGAAADKYGKANLVPNEGLGDEAYFAVAQDATMYVVRKGANLIAVGAGGNVTSSTDLPVHLLTLTKTVAAAL